MPHRTEINAFIHIADNGETTLYCGRCEMGQGIATALPAAVADELEADWDRVTVLQGDADEKFGPQATGGSNCINDMFVPMREAGAAAKAMLISAAAQRWGIDSTECYAQITRYITDKMAAPWATVSWPHAALLPAQPLAENPRPIPLHWSATATRRPEGSHHWHPNVRR